MRRALCALWRDLPVWFLAYLAWTTFHLELKNLDPPRPEFAWTAAFPLTWVALGLWWARGERTWPRLLKIALGVCAPLFALALAPVRPMSNAAILPWFECSTLTWVAVLSIHCWRTRSRGEFARLFGVGMLYGLILENGGIAMGFFSEPGYRLHVPGMPGPLATGLGWMSAFYAAYHFAHAIAPRKTVGALALLATAVTLSLDLQLDPAATAAAWWIWHPDLEPGFHNVPWVNYTAWFSAMLPYFLLLFWIQARPWTEKRKTLTLLVGLGPLLLAELVIVMALSAAVTGGVESPTMQIFYDALRFPFP